ncbi:hypothetical protein NHX12_033280 [Muraenolepis orangiensis]|uniref:Uncharacterized protein n=1 Tax=Muraenolepis orangiensis TaxID=630683 RepID=A0A9Q0E249_9TELE|nr:hypothetical protein NHX12_033280 [Muraenolepis orangiensis]
MGLWPARGKGHCKYCARPPPPTVTPSAPKPPPHPAPPSSMNPSPDPYTAPVEGAQGDPVGEWASFPWEGVSTRRSESQGDIKRP